jgi:hypothetical protein
MLGFLSEAVAFPSVTFTATSTLAYPERDSMPDVFWVRPAEAPANAEAGRAAAISGSESR